MASVPVKTVAVSPDRYEEMEREIWLYHEARAQGRVLGTCNGCRHDNGRCALACRRNWRVHDKYEPVGSGDV